MEHTINVLDSVQCKAVGKGLITAIAPCLTFKRTHARRGQFATTVQANDAYAIDRRSGLFLTGLLPRVCQYLDTQGVDYELSYINPDPDTVNQGIPRSNPPKLNANFILRPEQLALINNATKYKRGIIHAATGTGKTIVLLGFISQYTSRRVLILVHRLDLLNQFYRRMVQAGFSQDNINLVSGTHKKPSLKELLARQYTIAMVQSYGNYPISKLCDTFDIIAGDEIHHCVDKKTSYGKAMRRHLAPIRLGFTATLPPKGTEEAFTLEGLVGPVIGQLTINDATQSGSMAEPHVTLINVPYNTDVAEHRKWKDLYKYGIVNNRVRNGLILKAVKERLVSGQTCLIMVKEIQHGTNLAQLAKLMGFEALFIHGKHNSKERDKVREGLNSRATNCVITTDIWREGVDIPSLNVVVNACGGKSEIQTLQVIGRGARRAEGKDTVEIIDCIDVYRYLAEHFARRAQIYNQHGWI